MTTLDTTTDGSGRPAARAEEVPSAAAVIGPMAGDPSMLCLGSFIVGSGALGLALVGVVPAGVLGAPWRSSWRPRPWARARWRPSSASSAPSG